LEYLNRLFHALFREKKYRFFLNCQR